MDETGVLTRETVCHCEGGQRMSSKGCITREGGSGKTAGNRARLHDDADV